ncbi:DEAD-domain-containing protein [Mycena floridula]|nr:DEAD-domain-containing protein [Mycena floridula]
MSGVAAPEKPAGKTKAKQRYLRRKKERRKINKKAAPSKPEDEQQDDIESASEVGPAEEEDEEPEVKVVKEKRPKKRRKVEEEEDEDQEAMQVEAVVHRSPTPQASLPQFPLPVLPGAPSKSDLALQGLDQALVDAEIIDPTTTAPISTEADDGDLPLTSRMRKRLGELGISELFAVQTKLLPFFLPRDPLLRALYLPYNPPRDVCVSAPTGSGKTLAYVLPIIEILAPRVVTRLRALIVLPTRDLVMQVRETFEAVGKGRGLKITTATGQHSFSHEQSQLVADQESKLRGGSSKVDILICTPGRLMDHINETPNFSLQHLRFLVIDEADRLLSQSFQDWLAQVLAATRPPKHVETLEAAISSLSLQDPNTSCHDALSPAFLPVRHVIGPSYVPESKQSSCQKLLFSATLTRDPAKIAALQLRDPKYFVVQASGGNVAMEEFSMPATLTEHMIICDSVQKPMMLFHIVQRHGVSNALVFTKSTESTTRLVRLFEFIEQAWRSTSSDSSHTPVVARAYSSDLPVGERRTILEKFKTQEIQILVCSDLISRGIDISHVSHVVSYDVPVDMRKYVHRVGRTARAGRSGDAWTLVEEQEARHFKAMMKDAGHLERVKRVRVGEKELAAWQPHYEAALKNLKDVYTR